MGICGVNTKGHFKEGVAAGAIRVSSLAPPRYYLPTGQRLHPTIIGRFRLEQGCATRDFLVDRGVLSSMIHQRLVVGFDDSIGGLCGILVLPDADDLPPEIVKTLVGVSVPFNVLPDFPSPPFDIGLWPRPMDRAIVPEASIDEDCQTSTRKDDVGRTRTAGKQPTLDTEAQSPLMQSGANEALGPIVRPPRRGHSAAGLVRRWNGSVECLSHVGVRPPVFVRQSCRPAFSSNRYGAQRRRGSHPQM